MVEQSLIRRKPKADVAKQFIGVLSKDTEGKPKTLVVPGSEGKQYRVIIRRYPTRNLITLECSLVAGALGYVPCPGNSAASAICYHSRAALDYVIERSGYKAAWCGKLLSVNNLMRLHKDAKVYNVRSHQNGVQAWAVVYQGEVES